MKKILLAAAVLFGSAFAVNAEETFAPKKGDISTEIQFNPFGGDKIFSNGGVLQGRYFFTNKDAFLVEFGLSGTNDKSVGNTDNSTSFTKEYQGRFQINLGYQRHFYNYKRMDLYCGGKIGYVHDFAGYKKQDDVNNYEWTNQGDPENDKIGTGNGFNLYLTTGFDFYVYKGLYLGAEINLGFTDIVATNWTKKKVVNGVLEEKKSSVGGHNFAGGFNVNPLIRLGWKF